MCGGLRLVLSIRNWTCSRCSLTGFIAPSIVTAMQMCRTVLFHRRIVGSLIVVWLLLGGLAFAEQLNVVSETNSSDEQALTQLQLAVKSDMLDASIGAPLPNLLALSIIALRTAVASVLSNPTNSFADFACTRSLPRFTCCYRL